MSPHGRSGSWWRTTAEGTFGFRRSAGFSHASVCRRDRTGALRRVAPVVCGRGSRPRSRRVWPGLAAIGCVGWSCRAPGGRGASGCSRRRGHGFLQGARCRVAGSEPRERRPWQGKCFPSGPNALSGDPNCGPYLYSTPITSVIPKGRRATRRVGMSIVDERLRVSGWAIGRAQGCWCGDLP